MLEAAFQGFHDELSVFLAIFPNVVLVRAFITQGIENTILHLLDVGKVPLAPPGGEKVGPGILSVDPVVDFAGTEE